MTSSPSILTKQVAKGVIRNPVDNTALILHLNKKEREKRGIDEWHLPGGALEDGETLEEALVRETFEEARIRVEVLGKLGTSSWVALYEEVPARFDATIFEAVVEDGAVAQAATSVEHSELAWVTADELDDYALTPEAHRWIEVVLNREAKA